MNLWAHYNAKNWTRATIETLKDHYLRVQAGAIEMMRPLLVVDWDRAFLVAARRARQHTPHIKEEALEAARVDLEKIMWPSFPIEAGNREIRKDTRGVQGKPQTAQDKAAHGGTSSTTSWQMTDCGTTENPQDTDQPGGMVKESGAMGSGTPPTRPTMEEKGEGVQDQGGNPGGASYIPLSPEITIEHNTHKTPRLEALDDRETQTMGSAILRSKRDMEEEEEEEDDEGEEEEGNKEDQNPQPVDSFPGAKFSHAVQLLKNGTPPSPQGTLICPNYNSLEDYTTGIGNGSLQVS
ncbi:hypothetical protein D4764_01G0000030 [Takifugu flavidus]|uniref:Uncharacterized protein n=1 Tax=Takifugu flavidus TaxID=433684 RepID=A0A5C6PN77_9TELE|nr:hypothetical protein D4764_01G0000030 [Takifugu flavidus]